MDERPKRVSVGALIGRLVPVFAASIAVDYIGNFAVAVLFPAAAPVVIGLSQLTIAVGIAEIDLWVLYRVIGLGRHSDAIGAWMDRAFTGEGLKVMTKCPRCGYEAKAEAPSHAQRLLEARERS